MKTNTSHLLSLALATISVASPTARSNDEEHVVLADCGIGSDPEHPSWATSQYVFYYSAPPGTPEHQAQVTWDGSYPWRADPPLTITLDDGVSWKITIDTGIHDPDLAGLATRSGDDPSQGLKCYSHHVDNIATLADGTACRSAYFCNHKDSAVPAPPPVQSKIDVKVSTNSDFSILEGIIDAKDIYNPKVNDNDVCDETQMDLGGCKIKYRCHGNVKGESLPGMLAALHAMAEKADGMVVHEDKDERYWDSCASVAGPGLCVGGYKFKHVTRTKIPSTLSVYLSRDGDDQGELSYEMDCSKSPE